VGSDPPRRRGRPTKLDGDRTPPAYIIWRNGRAYGDFRAWKKWGGGQQPLVADGDHYATTDSATAAILFGRRLEELRDARMRDPDGNRREAELNAEKHGSSEIDEERMPDLITASIAYHLRKKATVTGRKQPSSEYLAIVRSRLIHAARFLNRRGRVTLAQITPRDIQAYAAHLRTSGTPEDTSPPDESPGRLKPTTQRRYLDALGQVMARAVGEGRMERNLVALMADKPTTDSSPTSHFELWEGSLILEAARRAFPPSEGGPPVYPMVAIHLLAGVTDSERAGIDLVDVRLPGDPEYPRGVILIRPTAERPRLKTFHRDRIIPMQPQLAEILTEYLRGPNSPKGPLLFPKPGSDGSAPITDWTDWLDRAGVYAGFAKGEVRTRRLRVTFATHRLSTLDEMGQPITAWKLRGEMGHGTEQMIQERYGRYARHRPLRPVLEYRWEEWQQLIGDRLSPRAPTLTPAQRVVLRALAESRAGLTAKEWELKVGAHPGSFYPRRDSLVAIGLVERNGNGRGSRFRLTRAGLASLSDDAGPSASEA
jgi:site-specific recombinase XerD